MTDERLKMKVEDIVEQGYKVSLIYDLMPLFGIQQSRKAIVIYTRISNAFRKIMNKIGGVYNNKESYVMCDTLDKALSTAELLKLTVTTLNNSSQVPIPVKAILVDTDTIKLPVADLASHFGKIYQGISIVVVDSLASNRPRMTPITMYDHTGSIITCNLYNHEHGISTIFTPGTDKLYDGFHIMSYISWKTTGPHDKLLKHYTGALDTYTIDGDTVCIFSKKEEATKIPGDIVDAANYVAILGGYDIAYSIDPVTMIGNTWDRLETLKKLIGDTRGVILSDNVKDPLETGYSALPYSPLTQEVFYTTSEVKVRQDTGRDEVETCTPTKSVVDRPSIIGSILKEKRGDHSPNEKLVELLIMRLEQYGYLRWDLPSFEVVPDDQEMVDPVPDDQEMVDNKTTVNFVAPPDRDTEIAN